MVHQLPQKGWLTMTSGDDEIEGCADDHQLRRLSSQHSTTTTPSLNRPSWVKKGTAGSQPGTPSYSRVFLDTEEMKQRVKDALAKPSYSVFDFYYKTGVFQWLAKSQSFETATLFIIGFNALWLAHDTNSNKSSSLLDARLDFQVAEIFFCTYYSLEWFIRFMAFERKCNCLRDGWFVFDSILVFMMVGETFVMTMLLLIVSQDGPTTFGFGNAGILRLFRLLRLTRMARMLRSMPELMILIKGMAAATTSVFFIMCLQLILLYVFAIAFTQLAADTNMGLYYFPNVLHSMYTLLLYGTFLDNLSQFCDEVAAESSLCLALIFVFVLLSACTVLNMLIGILCEVVTTVTAVEKEEMTVMFVTNKLQKVLKKLDSNNDGQLSKAEFERILEVPEAARALEEVGVDPVSVADFGNFIFGEEGTTDLDFSKFMEVLLTLRADNKCTLRDIISLRQQVKRQLDALVFRLCSDLPAVVGHRSWKEPRQISATSATSEERFEEEGPEAELRSLEAKTESLEGMMEEILKTVSVLTTSRGEKAPLEAGPKAADRDRRPNRPTSAGLRQVEAFYLPKRDYAREELLRSFRMRDSRRYLVALELALDAELSVEEIPCVYRLYRQAETFSLPVMDSARITAEFCLILDCGFKEGVSSIKDSLSHLLEDLKHQISSLLPVDLEMTVVTYNAWESWPMSAVKIFGGHPGRRGSQKNFDLGGRFTEDLQELECWIERPTDPFPTESSSRELTGALLAAGYLPWKAQKKLAVVITDSPCYGKDYSNVATNGPFCDKRSGLTCTGRPEAALKILKDKGVAVSIFHTGASNTVSMCETLGETIPELSRSIVKANEITERLVAVLAERLHVQPLTYILKPHMLELSADARLPQDSNLGTAHEMEVEDGSTTRRHTISADGLFFLGSGITPIVTLHRPADEHLDSLFETKSQQLELDGFFNGQKSYFLKMKPLRRSELIT